MSHSRTDHRSPSSSPTKRCFGAVSDRSADLGREDPVCGHLLTVKSFAPEDVAPVKKYLVQQLNEAFRRSEITENDKLTVASRTLNLFRHLQENAITSAKAYIHTDDGRRYVGLIDESFSNPFGVDWGKKFRVASDGLVQQVDVWSQIQNGSL